MKTKDEKEIRELFKQQKYKYCSLKNTDGKSIVTYNTENNAKVKAIDKLNEAFERLKILPDGLYIFCFANSKGRNVAPDEFHFVKGNIAVDEQGKGTPYQIINQAPAKNEYDKILSYPAVLELQMELTTLKFKLNTTEQELAKANTTINELEAEIKELEAKGLSENDPNSPNKWMEMIGTNLLPLADRWFGVREKELALAEKGINIAPRQQRPQQKQQRPQQQPQQAPNFPPIGSDEFNKWLDVLADAEDKDYDYTMSVVKKYSPEHYDAIVAELEGEEQEEQN